MYRVLRGEMVKANISVSALASQLKITDKTMRNKLNGETDFSWPEAKAIRRIVNPKMSMEDMFETDEKEKI